MRTTDLLYNSNNNDKKLGNHRVHRKDNGNIEYYYYHETCIFFVNKHTETIVIDNGGWYTRSTNDAIRAYVKLYNQAIEVLGYTVIDKR